MTKRVSFGDLTIREYPYELGDNPHCSCGAPVTIGWEPVSTTVRNLDLFEFTRMDRKTGKHKRQMMIPVQKRAQILFQAGYSIEQIAQATMEVDAIKQMRAESLKYQGWDRTKILLETTGKLPKGILTGMANLLVIKPAPANRKSVLARSA